MHAKTTKCTRMVVASCHLAVSRYSLKVVTGLDGATVVEAATNILLAF